MSANTSIQWTDRTWNPVRGCSVISPGCVNCYAMKQAHRFSGPGRAYEGLTKQTKAGPQWTGVVRTVESALLEPLSWRKPQKVFVNSMSDLFHEDVPWSFIEQVFDVMQQASRHTFQILTKRAENMRQFAENWAFHHGGPLPNVWMIVSVEDQQRADELIPELLRTPAAVRGISAEPLLGPLDLKVARIAEWPDMSHWMPNKEEPDDWKYWMHRDNGIRWVIVGGESGPGARPCDLAWIRSIVQQCQAAGVACFVKQLGAQPRSEHGSTDIPQREAVSRVDRPMIGFKDLKGGDLEEFPADLQVRQFPEPRG